MNRRPRPYYGWWMVGALSVTETISFGILTYSFTVFIGPMNAELGWSVASLTGAFSLGLLVAGLTAPLVGRWLDAQGARLPMSLGSLLAALLLFAWSGVSSLWSFYLVWAGLGVAMAGVLYEPAFAVLARWFRRDLGKAITVLTFLAGFASVIFIPLSGYLVETGGWRQALRVLASIQLATLPLHALLLRRRPGDLGLQPDGGRSAEAAPAEPDGFAPAQAFARSDFRRLAVAFSLSTFAITAMSVHLVPLLVNSGREPALAATIGGAIGLLALPGRLLLTPLGDLLPRRLVAAAIFSLQAAGIAVLWWGAGIATAVWAFVILYGAGFGAITPARAALLAEYYGGRHYGTISARMALINSLARAAAPVSTGALVTLSGERFGSLLVVLVVCCALAAVAVASARAPTGVPDSAGEVAG